MYLAGLRKLLISGLALLAGNTALAQAIQLPQADGGFLALPRPANSVITLSPHLTELVFDAGSGSSLIAVAEYSNYPAAASSLPRVGDAFRLDLERITSLQPDLVIAWESGNPAPAIDRLQALGVATWVIEIRQPGEIASTLEQIGMATGRAGQARAAADAARQQLAAIIRSGAGKPAVSYFYQVSAQPLFTLNGEHLVSRSLALCGGENVFAKESVLAPQVSMESIIVRDPEVMFAAAVEGQPDPLAAWQDWPKLQAVSRQRLYTLPADQISRATPRMLDAVATACRLLHAPENPVSQDHP